MFRIRLSWGRVGGRGSPAPPLKHQPVRLEHTGLAVPANVVHLRPEVIPQLLVPPGLYVCRVKVKRPLGGCMELCSVDNKMIMLSAHQRSNGQNSALSSCLGLVEDPAPKVHVKEFGGFSGK